MTPVRLDLSPFGYRGDAFVLDIPLLKPGPGGKQVPISVAEAETYRDTYTLIRMYVRVEGDPEPVFKASKADGELFINPNFQLPDGTSQPMLSIRIGEEKTQKTIEGGEYDIEFDYPGSLGPYTALRGGFALPEDVSYDDLA